MSWRTVIISRRCKLDYKTGYLVIRSENVQRVYLDEVALLMIENPAVSFTGCLMAALTEKKIKVIFCNTQHDPVAELCPYHGSHDSSQRIRWQIAWQKSAKEQVWQSIIQQKILNQAKMLKENGKEKETQLLLAYIDQVQPGDVTNREGHAAKVFFNALYGMSFTRGADLPVNAALNYGYGILLSAFNREINASGYLTQIGIFHDNIYNHFNLSCDLMEPFRILIDRIVYTLQPQQFGKEEKHAIWPVINEEILIGNRKQTLLNAIRIYCRSVFDALNENDESRVCFPQ